MNHESHFFYSLRGRLDAVTLSNPFNGTTLTVAHIRDAIFIRISKVLKDYCVIEINLVDPATGLQLFIGAPLEGLLLEADKQYEASGGAPRPAIGSAQRPFKITMDHQLAKICERGVEEEADKRNIKNEPVDIIMVEEVESLLTSPNTSRTGYSRRPLPSRFNPESVETDARTSKALTSALEITEPASLVASSSSSLMHANHSPAVEPGPERGRPRREPTRDTGKVIAITTQLLNTPYSPVTLASTVEQYTAGSLPSPVATTSDSAASPPLHTQRVPRKAAENAKMLLSRLPQRDSSRDWKEYSALRERLESEREHEEVRCRMGR